MRPSDKKLAAWLFLTLLSLYLLTSGGHFYSSDDLQKLRLLDSLLREGDLTIDKGWVLGLGHQRYSWFPIGASLLMLPGYALGSLAVQLFPMLPQEYVVRFFVSLQNTAVSAALVTLVFGYLRFMGRGVRTSLGTALTLGLATLVWPYAKTSWSEPATVLLLFGGLFAMQLADQSAGARGRWLLGASAAFVAAASIRQEAVLVALGAMAWWAWRHRGERDVLALGLAALGGALAAIVAISVWYNVARYGEGLNFANYRMPQAKLVMEEGRFGWSLKNLYQYTFSPNQGLLWFSPPVLLGLWGMRAFWLQHRPVAMLWLLTLLPLGGFYVYGWGLSSWAWGLRYAYVFLPFAILPMAWAYRPTRAWVFGGLVALGLGAQGLGVLHDFNRLYEAELHAHRGDQLSIQRLMTTPAHAPLWLAIKATPATLANGLAALTTPSVPAGDLDAYRDRRRNLPDFWFVLQSLSPIPRGLTALAAGLLALLFALSAWRLAVWARRPAPAIAGREAPVAPLVAPLPQGDS